MCYQINIYILEFQHFLVPVGDGKMRLSDGKKKIAEWLTTQHCG